MADDFFDLVVNTDATFHVRVKVDQYVPYVGRHEGAKEVKD
jgi:hypothetical protein